MSTLKFSCMVTPSNPVVPLGLEVWIDNVCVTDTSHVSESMAIAHEFADTDGEHTLRITLKNKQPTHTEIDESGAIVSDAVLTVTDISFDEVDCSQIAQNQAVYQHNFNGTGAEIKDRFFDTMGCNGTVEMKFTTPIYLWLLENM